MQLRWVVDNFYAISRKSAIMYGSHYKYLCITFCMIFIVNYTLKALRKRTADNTQLVIRLKSKDILKTKILKRTINYQN